MNCLYNLEFHLFIYSPISRKKYKKHLLDLLKIFLDSILLAWNMLIRFLFDFALDAIVIAFKFHGTQN